MSRKLIWVSIFAVAASTVVATSVLAVPGNITLASTSDSGVKGNFESYNPDVSADGTKVVFRSEATNLDPADTDNLNDIYVKDLTTGEITLVSTSDAGVKGNFPSFDPEISADGTKVVFLSASQLDPADTNLLHDIYLKDLTTGDTVLVSTSDAGVVGNNPSQSSSLTADGGKVAFTSAATNLDPADTDFLDDVYLKDLTTGDVTLASTSDSGVKANGSASGLSLSADGTKVLFTSAATNLDPADTDSLSDAYLKDLTTGDVTLASTSDSGVKGNAGSAQRSMSADGTKIVLVSSATNLDPDDTDSIQDVYVKDLTTGDLKLVSTSAAGVKGNDRSDAGSMSADGSSVPLWSIATNLDPGDTDSLSDIYIKDLNSGDLSLASTSDTGVKGDGSSSSPALSDDGTRVAFHSRSRNLDPADRNAREDVYVKELGEAPPTADVSVTKSDRSDPVTVGANINYRIVVSNLGPGTATGVTLIDELPAGVTFVSARPRQGTCTQAGGTVTCDLESLANGARATVSIVVSANAPGALDNTVSVSANELDPNSANNQDTETTTVQ